jgi:PAS domain-containing protein/DNA-binding CsgD family transcriptional regulator
MGARVRTFDWSSTALGHIAGWPQHRRTLVDLVLGSGLPMSVLWFPELIEVYNDAKAVLIGSDHHPADLGLSVRRTWPETAEAAEPIYAQVSRGETVTRLDRPWTLQRNGRTERPFFTTAYTPVKDETGAVAGILVLSLESGGEIPVGHRRGEAEDALRLGESRLSRMIDQLPIGVGLVDRDGRFLLRAGLLGHLWDEMMPSRRPGPGSWKAFRADGRPISPSDFPAERALRGETVSPGVTFTLADAGGKETWVRVSAAPFRNAAGEIEGAVAVLEDVDEETHTARRLRQPEEHLRLALAAGRMGIWEWDAATNLVTADAAHQALFGLAPQDTPMPAEIYWARMVPEDTRRGLARARDALQNNADIQLEERILRPDGELRWIASRGRAQAGRLIGVSYDVTDRVQGEQRLRESERLLKTALDLVELSPYRWNPVTGALHWDQRIRRLWSVPAGVEPTHDLFVQGIHPEDQPRVEAATAGALDPQGDGLYHIEYRVIGLVDGVERWVSTRGHTIFEDGKPIDFIGVAHEITERKRAEETLRRLNAAFEQTLMEQSWALAAATESLRRRELQAGLLHAAQMRAEGQADEERSREATEALRRVALLSRREREVLNHLTAGLPNKVIATELGLSVRTVEVHRAHMMQRLGVRNLAEAIRIAITAQMAAGRLR